MRLSFFFIISIFVLTASCKKSKLETVNNVGSIDSLSYQPSVAGSTWKYDTYINNIKGAEKTSICQSYDSIINSKTYDVYLNQDATLTFNRRDIDKYYNVLTSSTNKTELCVLDASKNVNDTWVGGVNGSDTYYYTIVEKNPTLVQNGITLKNVIKVYNERKDAAGTVTLSGYAWYAQGVGNIKSTGTISSIPIEVILTSADIK